MHFLKRLVTKRQSYKGMGLMHMLMDDEFCFGKFLFPITHLNHKHKEQTIL